MSRPLLFVIIALTLAAASLRAADDAAAVFDSLYGRKLQSVSATPTSADDVAFAAELLEAANKATDQPALLETLCDHAYTLGSKDPAGFKTVVQALSLLATYIETRHADALEKTAALEQRRLATAKPADKPAIAASLTQTLIELAESQRDQGDTTAALKLYQRAAVAIGSLDPAVRQRIVTAVDDITRQQKLLDLQHTLEAALKTNPADTKAAAKLARFFTVDRDDPAAALEPARAAADPVLVNHITNAAADPAALTPDQLSDLGDWYRGLSDEADAVAKPAMLERARGCYRVLLDADTATDLAKKKAELALDNVNAALARLSTATTPAIHVTPLPTSPSGTPPKSAAGLAEVKVNAPKMSWGTLKVGNAVFSDKHYLWTTVPAKLAGRTFTVFIRHQGSLDFEVVTAGKVIMAVTQDWGNTEEHTTRAALLAAGWKEENEQPLVPDETTPFIHYFSRQCKVGEKFHIKTSKYTAPILIK